MEAANSVIVALARLKGLFLEMPHARVSLAEASHAAGLDCDRCLGLLTALEDVRFLRRDTDGNYQRRPGEIDGPAMFA